MALWIFGIQRSFFFNYKRGIASAHIVTTDFNPLEQKSGALTSMRHSKYPPAAGRQYA